MQDLQYRIDDENGRIHLLFEKDSYAPDALNDLPTFEEALVAADRAMGEAFLGSRKEDWIGDLKLKQLLDLEEGLSLVTAINCRRASKSFRWRGEVYLTTRPDFGRLLIETAFDEAPVNRIERDLKDRLFNNYRDAIFSLSLALEHGKVKPDGVEEFSWWTDFWKVRGIETQQSSPAREAQPDAQAQKATLAKRRPSNAAAFANWYKSPHPQGHVGTWKKLGREAKLALGFDLSERQMQRATQKLRDKARQVTP